MSAGLEKQVMTNFIACQTIATVTGSVNITCLPAGVLGLQICNLFCRLQNKLHPDLSVYCRYAYYAMSYGRRTISNCRRPKVWGPPFVVNGHVKSSHRGS